MGQYFRPCGERVVFTDISAPAKKSIVVDFGFNSLFGTRYPVFKDKSGKQVTFKTVVDAMLESAVDSLRKENKELRSEIHLRDSINEQAKLDFEERIVYLENFVSDTEWGVYEGRK